MIPLTLEEIGRAATGELRAGGGGPVTGVTIDSRRVEPGDLFVAVGRGAAGGRRGVEGDAHRGDQLVDGDRAVAVAVALALRPGAARRQGDETPCQRGGARQLPSCPRCPACPVAPQALPHVDDVIGP